MCRCGHFQFISILSQLSIVFLGSPVAGVPWKHHLYGIPKDWTGPWGNIAAKKPDLASPDFLWQDSDLSMDPRSLPQMISPPPSAEDPPGGTYPQALSYVLEQTSSHTRGHIYRTGWSSANNESLRNRLLITRIPPKARPSRVNGELSVQPIPGMIQLIPGVPFVQLVDGENPTTVACLHTAESLGHYPDVAQEVRELTKQLESLTFGVVKDGIIQSRPIYTLPGLKRNDRSAKVPSESYDGSYNLASTVMKGEGQGCFLPAVQTTAPQARKHINAVTTTLHRLGRIVLQHSISKFEWLLFDFICTVNNVVGFGGIEPNGTGLQMNVSSGFTSLADLIGEHQGGYHSDCSDDYTLWTVLTLLFRLPKGSPFQFLFGCADLYILPGADHGPFLLARPGFYVREQVDNSGIICIHLVFRGNDLHSGLEPTEPPLTEVQRANIDQLIKLTGPQNRVAYVNYPNITGIRRRSALSFSPALGYWNLGSAPSHKLCHRHFTDVDVPFLGSDRDRAQRIGFELILAFNNALAHSGLRLKQDLNDILTEIVYEDKKGDWQALSGFTKFHPTDDVEQTHQWLGYYRWYLGVCSSFLIYITKAEYKKHKVLPVLGISPAFFPQPTQVRTPEDEDVSVDVEVVEQVLDLETQGDVVSVHKPPLEPLVTQL